MIDHIEFGFSEVFKIRNARYIEIDCRFLNGYIDCDVRVILENFYNPSRRHVFDYLSTNWHLVTSTNKITYDQIVKSESFRQFCERVNKIFSKSCTPEERSLIVNTYLSLAIKCLTLQEMLK